VETYLARAMQTAMLNEGQIQQLQAKETILRYPLANADVQAIFGLPPIRKYFDIPDDAEVQANHASRIDGELKRFKMLSTEYGFPSTMALEAIHALDWAVFHKRDEINFFCLSGGGRAKGRRLEDSV
jgi:hypothetical protein